MVLILTLTFCSIVQGATTTAITVHVDRPGPKISPTMWGIFLEDINFAADGGLYAELVKNRSFEFPDPMMGWSKMADVPGEIEIRNDDFFNQTNLHYLRIQSGGVTNAGFRGMGIRDGKEYEFSVQARAITGQPRLCIELVTAPGKSLRKVCLEDFTNQWMEYKATIKALATEAKAQLHLYMEGTGSLDLDRVSLFPARTWKNRPKGLRPDLVQMLADLKPGFIKFPGGFLTEGRSLEGRYQWKDSIGDPAERKLKINTFARFPGRMAPDYFQSYDLGFFEFFQLCEDLEAEPQPVLSCGIAANFTGQMAPLDELESYIQEALDLLEFVNGPVSSPWGKRRAELGHPRPFDLKTIRLGNEQQGQAYVDRFQRIAQAIKARYPDITLIAGSGPAPDDDNFKFMQDKLYL